MIENAPTRTNVRAKSVAQIVKPSWKSRLITTVLGATLVATLGGLPAAPSQAASSTGETPTATTSQPIVDAATKAQIKRKKQAANRKARVKLRKSSSRQIYRTTQIAVRIHIKAMGKRAKLKVTSRGKKVLTRTLKSRNTKVLLPKSLRAGKHRLKFVITPGKKAEQQGVRTRTKRITVRVITKRAAIVQAAKKHVGVPYRSGGSTPRGFDCSGFTSYVFDDALDISLPHSSSAQRYAGKRVSRAQAKPGDIIWSPGHVAIYLGGNKQIDAPRPGLSIHVRSIYQSNPVFISVV